MPARAHAQAAGKAVKLRRTRGSSSHGHAISEAAGSHCTKENTDRARKRRGWLPGDGTRPRRYASTSRRPRCATCAARVAKGRLTQVGQQPGNQPHLMRPSATQEGNRSRTRKSSWCREFHAVAPKLDQGKHSPVSLKSNACATRSMGHEEQPKQPNKQLSAAIANARRSPGSCLACRANKRGGKHPINIKRVIDNSREGGGGRTVGVETSLAQAASAARAEAQARAIKSGTAM